MNENAKNITRRIARGIFIFFLIFIIGGLGGVYFDQKVLPMIRTSKHLSRINFLKRSAENVTVINKTEQVIIQEDDSVNEIASQASNTVVNIISISSQNSPASEQGVREQSGTGMIATSDGLITTYRTAIIEDGAIYKVFLFNGNSYDAKLLGVDEFSNLAFLKIDTPNLMAIPFGDSSDARPGKKLVAIGNSFGEYQNRYASGLLSSIDKTFNLAGKSVSSTEKLESVFEDDFSDRREYIGGPVIGHSGDLVGIVGMTVIDGKEKYFLIPSSVVKNTVDFVLKNGFEARPFFGAYYKTITKEFSMTHGLNRDRGALIYSPSGKQSLAFISGSPAEIARLKINDIVTMVNNQGVNLDNPLSNLINQYKKGDKIELTVDRNGEEIKIPVQL
jgi:serine protease Do